MKITDDYIRGLVDGEGCFSFHTNQTKVVGENLVRMKIPVFAIGMHERDKNLIESVRNHLKLKNKVYVHKPYTKDGMKRGRKAVLYVRDLGALKNTIIPFFYKKLVGNKMIQFFDWLEKIGKDERVADRYKILYRLYKAGYWDRSDAFNQLKQ